MPVATMSKPVEKITVAAPNFATAVFTIQGTTPLVIHAFSQKAMGQIRKGQTEGQQAKIRNKREPKNFQEAYENAMYKSPDGWCGISAAAMRAAMIAACRVAGVVMTRAKLSVFVQPDGYDAKTMTPLIKIAKGEPQYYETYVRLDNGSADLRARPRWAPGWEAKVTITYDADQMALGDVTNLLVRVGMQVGIGEGRPNSKESCGMGFGLFKVMGDDKEVA